MAILDVVNSALEHNWAMVDQALKGLDDATLNQRPSDQSNSIAWTLWHMSRVVDRFMHTRLRGTPEVWIRDSWYLQFGMNHDPAGTGVGWNAGQVAGWTAPSREVLLGYYEAVKVSAREVLSTLTISDLENRDVLGVQLGGTGLTQLPPENERRSVAVALGVMTYDNIAHGGQIAYLRGLYKGMGWLAPSGSRVTFP